VSRPERKSQRHKVKNARRGRLSTIDQLPNEASDAVLWLNQELRERKLSQVDIRDQFNEMLARLDIEPVSKGAFSRYSIQKAAVFKEMEETRTLALELADSMGMDSAEKTTLAVAQMTRSASIKLLEKGRLTPQDLNYLGKAMKDAAAAEKISTDLRREIEKEALDKVEEVASSIGVSDETIAKLRKGFLGVGS
jgi:hypothetical protein